MCSKNLNYDLYFGVGVLGLIHGQHPHTSQRRRICRGAKKIDLISQETSYAKPGVTRGRPPLPAETVLLAVLYRLREGCSWRALRIFAPHTTIYSRWKQWCETGLWDVILGRLATGAHGRLWAVDSTSSKAHKHARGARRSAGCQCIGTSRGGPNTKIHALVDSRGRAVQLRLTPGNAHDLAAAPALIAGITDRTILADSRSEAETGGANAYDSDAFRELLASSGLRSCIPAKSNRLSPAAHHRGHYRHRHKVENFFQRLKERRAIATRYEKLASRFLALTTLAAICDWLQN